MKRLEIIVPCIPKGQPRARAFSRGGHARLYTPGTAEAMKSAIAAQAMTCRDSFPFVGPVSLEVVARFPRPKAHCHKNGIVKPGAPLYHTSKPDGDNVAKAVMDALTELSAWGDDASVADLTVKKRYAYGQSGLTITIQELEGERMTPTEREALLKLWAEHPETMPLTYELLDGRWTLCDRKSNGWSFRRADDEVVALARDRLVGLLVETYGYEVHCWPKDELAFIVYLDRPDYEPPEALREEFRGATRLMALIQAYRAMKGQQ